ncbi:MAG: archease [Candidatus Omnitrophota bacterium]|nr:MAG: archease [Candidatus Omnitrophota bacterium]
MKEKKYQILEHTADIGIKVKGKDLKELFKNAAVAMFDIIVEKKPENTQNGLDSKKIFIRQEAQNSEELFINWLNELLSLSAAKEMIFEDFQINKLDEENLIAQVRGVDTNKYKVNTEIKAATYHGLKIEKGSTGWQAEVIFDV